VAKAAQLMRDRNIGDVLVTDEGKLVGIVTDRDIALIKSGISSSVYNSVGMSSRARTRVDQSASLSPGSASKLRSMVSLEMPKSFTR
jgi:CBS domain-containing protein